MRGYRPSILGLPHSNIKDAENSPGVRGGPAAERVWLSPRPHGGGLEAILGTQIPLVAPNEAYTISGTFPRPPRPDSDHVSSSAPFKADGERKERHFGH